MRRSRPAGMAAMLIGVPVGASGQKHKRLRATPEMPPARYRPSQQFSACCPHSAICGSNLCRTPLLMLWQVRMKGAVQWRSLFTNI
jgi:hypothetical protein